MIFRLLLACLLSLFSAAVCAAQQGAFVTIRPGETLSGRFVQERHLKAASRPLRSEGRFLLAPGKGLIWRGEKPFGMVSVITAAGIVQTVDGVETVRMPATRLPFLRQFFETLSGALAGDFAALERNFSMARSANEREWRVVLEPARHDVSATAHVKSIALTGARFLETVEIRRTDGDWETIAFADQVISTDPMTQDDASLFDMVQP